MINKFGLSFCLMPLVGIASAANSVTYDFNSSSTGDLFTESGVTGWSQNNTNPSAFNQTFALGYISATDFGVSSNAAQLGTFRGNTTDNSDTILTGSLTSLTAGGQQNAPHIYNMVSVSFDLAVLDSSADSFAGRDGFSAGLTTDAGAQAATVGFTPTAGNNDTWDISVGVNGNTATTAYTINANSGYKFYIDSRDGTTDFRFGASDGSGAIILIDTIVSPFYDGFRTSLNSVTGIAFTHDPLADVGSSANAVAIDNISVQIPEPSSSLLMVLSAGLIAIRRRR
jgi:hypothetical protein